MLLKETVMLGGEVMTLDENPKVAKDEEGSYNGRDLTEHDVSFPPIKIRRMVAPAT